MKIARSFAGLFVLFLAIAGVAFFFLNRMYRGDIGELNAFVASYEGFDQAMSDSTRTSGADLTDHAGPALSELQTRATLRLSSLIRNDAELMGRARDVADLGQKELAALRAYDASRGYDPRDPEAALSKNRLASELILIGVQRRAAFARFEDLAGINERKRNESKKGDGRGG